MAAAHPLDPLARRHRKLLLKLLAAIVLAFGFGFALVPLYDAFCALTGLNGKTRGPEFIAGGLKERGDGAAARAPSRIDTSRTITVEFVGTVMPGLPWEMQPVNARMDLHPGELHQASYRVHNLSDKTIVGQAIPSVSPGEAALHFQKLDCFCFAQQMLAPGETKELPLTFIVQPEVASDVRTITLAYSFFNVAPNAAAAAR
ncbi:cytochrome c oxidase assembly protein [Propionivibrio soli]|uniref:cytochrome c oxidase assembly protein n=1 Tax=Propionivibrio soli TaxID=2976531 RepID=UPI0021E7951C|nr:cytochrome c oxidase assembly protein [Propionivibrio soli]